jgi:hypothetical protein
MCSIVLAAKQGRMGMPCRHIASVCKGNASFLGNNSKGIPLSSIWVFCGTNIPFMVCPIKGIIASHHSRDSINFEILNYKINWNKKCLTHIWADVISGACKKFLARRER